MNKLFFALAMTIILSGCMSTDVVRNAAATLYDEGLDTSERFICNDSSIGAIKRRYGSSPERANAWKQFCATPVTPDILK